MDFPEPGCGCETQDSVNKGLCYVEGIVKDYTGQDLHENVWFSMKPPKHVGTSSNPQVSARTVEVTRAELTGKANIYKSFYETSPKAGEDKHNKANIQKRKAGVSFVKKRGE